MIDKSFDIMNIRSTSEFRRDRKDFLQPFSSIDDHRLVWLEETFLQYFEDWLKSIKNRPGNLNTVAQQNMFLSAATYKGIQITTNSLIGLVKYLLNHGVSYILTERFSQDPLEVLVLKNTFYIEISD